MRRLRTFSNWLRQILLFQHHLRGQQGGQRMPARGLCRLDRFQDLSAALRTTIFPKSGDSAVFGGVGVLMFPAHAQHSAVIGHEAHRQRCIGRAPGAPQI